MLCSAYYIRVHKHKKNGTKNSVFYIFTQTIAISQYAFLWTCETSLPKNLQNFQNITGIVMKSSFKSFSGENVVD